MGKLNRFLLVVELVCIVLPVTILLLVYGLPIGLGQLLNNIDIGRIAIASITILALLATLSVWFLSIEALLGHSPTDKEYYVWWMFVGIGVVIAVAAIVVPKIVTPEPYSDLSWFIDQLRPFLFGAPLVVPAIHTAATGAKRTR